MIDLTLRECPFCGNPAEIVDAEPFSFMPNTPTRKIRCSWSMCIGYSIDNRYQVDLEISEIMARVDWNIRKKKNKLTFNDEYVIEHSELEQLKEHNEQNSIIEALKPRECADIPKEIICNCTKEVDMTNFKKIKSMTEEEFANWLCKCVIPEDRNEDMSLYGYGDFYYEKDIVKMLKGKSN